MTLPKFKVGQHWWTEDGKNLYLIQEIGDIFVKTMNVKKRTLRTCLSAGIFYDNGDTLTTLETDKFKILKEYLKND